MSKLGQVFGSLFRKGKEIDIVATLPASPPSKPLVQRCLEMTGFFETSKRPPDCYSTLAGNFDGQGLSMGVLQWNIGQGTLQPLFRRMLYHHEGETRAILGDDGYRQLRDVLLLKSKGQKQWAGRLELKKGSYWGDRLRALGATPAFQQIQVHFAGKRFEWALRRARELGYQTERAVALLFDIRVQNGSVGKRVTAEVKSAQGESEFEKGSREWEVASLMLLANRRAEVAHPRWVEDVRARKLTIARGKGKVHGHDVDLARDFGINWTPAKELEEEEVVA